LRKTNWICNTLLVSSLSLILPALGSARTNDDSTKAEAGEAVAVNSQPSASPVPNSMDSPEAQAPRQARGGNREAGMIGVGVRLSTLGAGAEVAVSLTRSLNVRGGFNIFQYSRGFNHDGIAYKGQLNLRSGEAHLDWYPFGHGFHLSPGLLVYNGNGATATASVPGNSTFSLGGTTYLSDPANPITGTGKLDFVKVAPTALFGFGNLVPRSRHFAVNFEMGAVFQGSPRTKLNLTGNACDTTGANCVSASTDPNVLANVVAEQTKLDNKLSPFKYYPVISFGFGYRF